MSSTIIERAEVHLASGYAADEEGMEIIQELLDELNRVRDGKSVAYTERNRLVALLSTMFPAGKGRTDIEGWSPEWHGVVYIDFPWGQASWHFHDKDAGLFDHLPEYQGKYDGHTTQAKYEAIQSAVSDGTVVCDVLARYSGDGTWRQWWSGGAWLYPGMEVVVRG